LLEWAARLRCGSLRWSQVALDEGKLHVRRAKGSDSGVHPL
jgi:hypothetical protein